MRNRCILGLLMVFGISLVSVVAFANSFTGEPAKKTDRVEIITQAAVSEEKNVAPYETPAATEIRQLQHHTRSRMRRHRVSMKMITYWLKSLWQRQNQKTQKEKLL